MTVESELPPSVEQAMQVRRPWLESMRSWIEQAQILDEQQLQQAGAFVTQLTQFKKTVVEERQGLTRGAYETIRKIEARYRPVVQEVDRVVALVEKAMITFRKQQEDARQHALFLAQQQAHALRTVEEVQNYQTLVAFGAQPQEKRVAGVVFRKKWRGRVVNPSLVPAAFWRIDQEALDAYAEQNGANAFVPGVIFEQEEDVGQVRTK